MQSADWFNNLDENVRTGLLSGIQQKYQNWEKGYSSKYQELASARKSYDSRESQLRDQEARVQKWLYGEGDPLGETRAEMERMKTQHEAALGALRSEYEKEERRRPRSRVRSTNSKAGSTRMHLMS
jgi:hypothetical protein